jgi:ferric-dicitrate binding protein FerR (iron transport regulator)
MNVKPVYNTITTANGNQYQLILTDGSKVWLNAASSIRFPTSFTGNERKVEITGEVYFEVAKDPIKPFKVDFKNKEGEINEIEVLGTHFNVNAYADEPDMKTTLLEGSVKIKAANKIQMLTPGQQASITSGGIEVKRNVDIEHVMAWKNGYFLFDNTDIYTLMRQVSRWYNVDVKYEGRITEDGFSGKILRDVPLSKFIKVLELNDVKVRTEGREIIVGFSELNY